MPQLSEEEWGRLRGKCREWFALAGEAEAFRTLGKWDFELCRMLASPPEHPGFLSRAWWKLLSRCRGRRDVTTGLKGSFPLAAVGNSFPADWFLTFCASLGLAGTPVLK